MLTDIFEKSLCEIEAEERGEQFRINCDRAANWLLRKLANIESEKARITAQAAEMVKQLDADAERLRGRYEAELIEYARLRLMQTGNRRRSLTLLQGTVAFRSVPASIRVFDPFRALDYAQKAAPALVRTQVSIDAAGYRDHAAKHLKETGQLLPGIETTPARETHRLTFGKD